MANSVRKRGQKIARRFSRTSAKMSEGSREHIRENIFERISHIQNIRLLILEWSLLVLALIMLSVTQAFWFANSYAKNTFVPGGTYIEATVGRVSSMNPLFATTSSEKVLSRLMFATLVANDYSGHPGVGLAESIKSSEDGKVWSVKLRDGLKWSDGEPLTNEDVLFTLKLIQSPSVSSVYDANLSNVSISENEKGEIVFTLPTAYADFSSALEIPIVPKHELEDADLKVLIEDSFSNAPVTSGAFAFNATQASSGGENSTTYLTGNPYYYGGKPMLSSFGVHTYTSKDDIVAAINAGSVTATAELSGSDVEKIGTDSFEKEYAEINSGVFAFLNTGNGALKNVEVRRAIRQGIDTAALRELVPDAKALDYPLLDSQIQLKNYPAIPAYDQAAARTKLGESKVGLSIVTVNSGYLPEVAENIKNQLTELGVDCGVTVYEETQDFAANVLAKRAYDILIYEIELGADPDLLPYYHSSQTSTSGLNLSNYRNSLVDDLLVGARGTLDASLRAKKYESFLEYWVNDAPAIGLYQANLTYIYNKNVRAFDEDAHLVTALDRFGDVTNWAANKDTRNLTP